MAEYVGVVRWNLSPKTTPAPDQGRHNAPHTGWITTAGAASKRSTLLWIKRKQQQKPRRAASVEDPDLDFINGFRQAINDVNVQQLIRLFPEAQKRKILDGTLLWRTVQCIHESLRRRRRLFEKEARREAIEELIEFAEQIGNGIRKGELEPDRRAHMHLITVFKESGAQAQGIAFWEWLEGQDDQYVGLDVYGAAIELLAVNGTPLRELEQLYERALQRFPASFNAYHLSPEAVVPDREKAIEIKGISITLLQGILTARLMRGESRKAYLALDTALRLYPVLTPPRFFAIFVEERPLAEAYTVFALACRAGIVLPFDTARKVLTALRTNADLSSHDSHVAALRQMLSVVYMYIGAGGSITSNVVNETVIAICQILRLHGIAGLNAEQKKRLVSTTLDVIRKTLEMFARYGATPGISAFNSIIVNLGGYGQSKQIITVALRDAQALGLEANHVTRRSILAAAGMQDNKEYVAEIWQDLVHVIEQQGKKPEATDYYVLVKAARMSRGVEFAEEACQAAKAHLPEAVLQNIIERLRSPIEEEQASGQGEVLDVSSLLAKMEQLRADLAVLDERTLSRPATHNFAEQRLPMFITSLSAQQNLPKQEQRTFYDELTTEQEPAKAAALPEEPADALTDASTSEAGTSDAPTQDALTAHASLHASTPSPAVSTSEIPFGTLRYENWKTINYLLALAEVNDNAYNSAVDKAITAGMAPPPREKVLRTGSGQVRSYYGLSDTNSTVAVDEGTGEVEQIEKGRSEILRLRGRLAEV